MQNRKEEDILNNEETLVSFKVDLAEDQPLSLQAFIISSVKSFVSKDNRTRHEKHAKDTNYSQYNKDLILKEFIGHKLYSCMVRTPKTYITSDINGDLQIHSQKKPQTCTLNEYLCKVINNHFPDKKISQIKEVDFLDQEIKKVLKKAICDLEGIGALCFMALWLQDYDVFGIKLDNVLVENNKTVSKIDTSEIHFKADSFEEGISALLTQKKYLTHEIMPFFLMTFDLLNEKEKQEGINAIYSLKDETLKNTMNWLVTALNIDHYDAEHMYSILRDRRNAILLNASDYLKNAKHITANTIEQDVIIRPASDFVVTREVIKGGNANPKVSQKVGSEKKDKKILFMCAYSNIKSTLLVLDQKINLTKDSEEKKALIKAKLDLQNLLKNVDDILSSNSYKRAQLLEIDKAFNQIINKQVYPALEKLDDFLAKLSNVFIKNKVTTKDEIDQLSNFINKKFQTFFQSRKTVPTTKIIDNEEQFNPKKKYRNS